MAKHQCSGSEFVAGWTFIDMAINENEMQWKTLHQRDWKIILNSDGVQNMRFSVDVCAFRVCSISLTENWKICSNSQTFYNIISVYFPLMPSPWDSGKRNKADCSQPNVYFYTFAPICWLIIWNSNIDTIEVGAKTCWINFRCYFKTE